MRQSLLHTPLAIVLFRLVLRWGRLAGAILPAALRFPIAGRADFFRPSGARSGLFSPLFRTLIYISVTSLSVATGFAADPAPVTATAFLNSLSHEERAWLRDHPRIRVFQDPDWPPIEFVDPTGNPVGMTKDYLSLVEKRLGLTCEPVLHLSWQQGLDRLKRAEIDLTTTVAVTPERLDFWAFTKPYMNIPIVIATQQDVTYISSLRELAGKQVAVVDGYAVCEWIPRDFPDLKLVKVPTSSEGLQRLERGEVHAFIDSLLTISYFQAKREIWGVKIAGTTPYFNAQCMAVRKDWAPFAGILQKALESISASEHETIYNRWLPIRYEVGFNYVLFWKVLAFFVALLLGLGWWIQKLRREIQARKHAQAAQRIAEEEFRLTFELLPNPVTLQTQAGVLRDCNISFCDVTGFSREEALGHTTQDLNLWADPAQRQVMRDLLQRQGRLNGLEINLTRRDGQIRIMQLSARFLALKPEPLVLTVATDITERKQAEAALQLTRLGVEGSSDAMFWMTPEASIFDVNAAACRSLGYSRAELVGLGVPDIDPHYSALFWPQHFEELRQRKSLTFITEHRAKDGRIFPVEVVANHIHFGEQEYNCAFVRDITERKRVEELLRNSEAHFREALERQVCARTLQLEAANKELEAFSYSVSHDLRAPLRGIDGWSLALAEDYSDKLDATGIGYVDRVRSETQRMGHLIDDLLKLAKVTRAEMLPRPIDLSALAAAVSGRLLANHEARKITVTIAPGLAAHGDPRLLEIVLTNLFENAFKFTGARPEAQIVFGQTLIEGAPAFFIRDNGAGFDMAYASTLFGAFQRMHKQSEFPGTGIGLATVQRIVNRHAGRIWAEACPDAGATFYFTLGNIL